MDYDEFKKKASEIHLGEFLVEHYGIKTDGKNYSCIKPDHKDNHPSMKLFDNREEGRGYSLYCQVCKENFNIFTSIGILENLEPKGESFVKIMEIISEKTGIEMPKFKEESENAINIKKTNLKYSIMFKKRLYTDEGFVAREYLKDRGFDEQTILDFHLGLTPKEIFTYHLSGISDRISIPILSDNGKYIIATSFRTLTEYTSKKEAKYKHDANNEIFNKSETLFGYSHAIDEVRKTSHLFLVEGYFDMMSLYQIGIKNTMAYLGATLTKEQIEKISRICKNVTLIVDQDEAGKNGLLNATVGLLNNEINVRVLTDLECKAKDMNDLCNYYNWDYKQVKYFIDKKSVDSILFILNNVCLTYEDKMMNLKYTAKTVTNKVLGAVKDPIKKEIYKKMFEKRID